MPNSVHIYSFDKYSCSFCCVPATTGVVGNEMVRKTPEWLSSQNIK